MKIDLSKSEIVELSRLCRNETATRWMKSDELRFYKALLKKLDKSKSVLCGGGKSA